MSQYLNVSPYLVATYQTFAVFPPSATDGALAVALDTTNLYIYEQISQTWKLIGAGSVTSIGVTVPDFLSVTPSVITNNGTFVISYSGTPLPIANGGTNAITADSALNNLLPSQAGNNGFFLETNGSNTSWRAPTSGVTSVGLIMPALFSVANSPITSSGNMTVTYSGSALPYNYGGTNATTPAAAIQGLLPSYIAGDFLTNNGTTLSWGTSPNPTGITGASPGGTATVTGGPSTVGSPNGGAVTVSSAAGNSSGTGGTSGNLNLTTGNANGTGNNSAGAISISAGTSSGTSTGGTVTLISGTGGVPASGNSGTGGTSNLDGGNGGAGTNGNAGNGGGATLKAGSGGNTAASSNFNAGTGGQTQVVGGTGGTLGASGTGTPGNGGAVSITGGSPGSNAGAAGGNVTVSGGGGSSVGSGGNGGTLTLSSGAAAGDNTTNQTGGSITISVGHSNGSSGGSNLTMTAGTGGVGTGTAGASGGTTTINSGTGGLGSATGGNGGNLVLVASPGGNSGTPGSGGVIIFQTAATNSATEKFRVSNNGTVFATNSQLQVATAGFGLSVKSGSNCKMGTAVLAAGTVTVSNTTVTSNSLIFLTSQVNGGTPGFLRITAKTVSTSFVITSSSNTDTSTVAWMIMEQM